MILLRKFAKCYAIGTVLTAAYFALIGKGPQHSKKDQAMTAIVVAMVWPFAVPAIVTEVSEKTISFVGGHRRLGSQL